ncbi:sulfotransferase domain-containing protein [Subsaxibacter sp. CAU 1640]|uniref:sulfotransferase domain-containing protein n=1 Tax=Subsaxibacter sp. CAU 1640 TaxID=2933271 RepID=UPI002003C6E8|nr:sulfotransferase domain-containing protein [Subsaxibacter sp. CAU 1640]MCK7589895.1 sulfotransferase domain-containing protein [Subsaxibacter sp. CAU 1640]
MGVYNKHIIIVGTARSGTSWISETIAKQHRYRMLFEPEHETNTSRGYLLCDQLIQTKEDSIAAHLYLKKVFANRVDCDWIAQCSNRKFKRHLWPFIPKRFIIKFVRGNLSAAYMNRDFDIPVVHILRNPYDVLHSQQQVNFPWLYNLEIFKSQNELVRLIRDNFHLDIKNTEHFTPLEVLTLRWCIENVIPLKLLRPQSKSYHVIKYEDLRKDINLFRHMCNELNLEPIKKLEEHYESPSSKTHKRSKLLNGDGKIQHLKESEYLRINKILDLFSPDFYDRRDH